MSIKITSVRSFSKENKNGQMKKTVVLNNTIFLPGAMVSNAGYANEAALQGNEIDVEYYALGEKLISGEACTKADTIVKNFSITASADDIRFAKLANAGVKVTL